MPEFTTARLLIALQAQRPLPAGSSLCVALSGGLDSVVLTHGLAQLAELQQWKVRALHIDHQLQSLSTEWSQHCEAWAQQLNLACKTLRVEVKDIDELGVEAAARNARYAALREELQPDEVLLTAHHADDQLETVLLALMRGAGVNGLAAMPALARFGLGWHLRPLLGFTREELAAWAGAHQLQYIDDPTNASERFDRNFLRRQVVPLLKARWPAAAHTATRSAAHLSAAQQLLDEFVAQDYARAERDGCLNVEALRRLDTPRRHALLRHWLQQHQVLMPSTNLLKSLDHDMLCAADDRVPCTCWNDVAIYRYGGYLYLEHELAKQLPLEMQWHWRESLELPTSIGLLQMQRTDESRLHRSQLIAENRLPENLIVRFREGGECIQLPGAKHRRRLKTLLQECAILPWWRGRVPLIYAEDKLVAVGDLWVDSAFAASHEEKSVRVTWSARPKILAIS